MNINNVNQIFNQKIQDINSRLPKETSVSNKFQNLLEQAQLKNSTVSSSETTKTEATNPSASKDTDINSLLKTMLSTQSLLNSTSFSSDSSSSSLFPTSTFNNTINTLQQTQLLNALTKNSFTNSEQ